MTVIETEDELNRLPAEAHIWGAARRYDRPGSGKPYSKLDDETWWDFGNNFGITSRDIKLPALLVWDGRG